MNETEKYEKRKRLIINVVFFSMIGAAVFAVCRYLLPVLVPFLVAFVIAAVMQTPIKKIGGESRNRQKITAVLLCSLFYAVFFLLVTVLGVKLFQGVGDVVANAPSLYHDWIAPILDEVAGRMEIAAASVDEGLSQKVEDAFREFSQNAGQYVTDWSLKMVRMLSSGAAGIPGFIVKLVITVVSTFFMAMDFDTIRSFLGKCIPTDKKEEAGKAAAYARNILFIYLKSYSLLFLLTFAELSVGFLAMGIPYAVLLAIAVAVFDILPVLGTGGILLPWAAVLLAMGNLPMAAGMLALYIVNAPDNTVCLCAEGIGKRAAHHDCPSLRPDRAGGLFRQLYDGNHKGVPQGVFALCRGRRL